MFKQLLVSLDGAPEAASVVPTAAGLAEAVGAEMTLVRCIGPESGLADEADAYLDWIASDPRHKDRVTARIVRRLAPREHIADAILATARERGADLIVMATHGRGGLNRMVMGSVAQRVVEHAPLPVLVQRPDTPAARFPGVLLVPVDGTPGALVGLGAATALAEASRSRLVVLQTVTPFQDYLIESGVGYDAVSFVDPAWEEESRRSAETYVAGLVTRLRDRGREAEGHVVAQNPVAGIDAVAAEVGADLIVMATHALTGFKRTVLGSVADAVVRTARRPVLLVRRREDATEADPESTPPAG